MRFVSVIPTSAFAGTNTETVGKPVNQNLKPNGTARDLNPKYQTATVARRAVEDLGKDVKAMYTALAADQTVFGTAKTIYDMTDSLSKDLLKGIGSYTYFDNNGVKREIYEDDLATNVRKSLNVMIGNEITNYMNKRVGQFTSTLKDASGNAVLDKNGNEQKVVKPEKYLEVWGNAVKSALASEKAQKNIEAMVTGLFALKVQKTVNDGANDLYTDIVDWDHWNEFNWGKIGVDVRDPDAADDWSIWNPVPGTKDYGALIATDSNGLDFNVFGGITHNALIGAIS
jgi:hypothetical protein